MTVKTLLIDFGSTFTKVVAVAAGSATVLGRADAPTTVEAGLQVGLQDAVSRLDGSLADFGSYERKLACSSAAGGLRMVAVGLVPELTAEAARRAALGAGARVAGVYAYRIGADQISEIEGLKPDMLLLAGGTDGGNREILLDNARSLADSSLTAPVVIAGNQDVAEDAARVLRQSGIEARVTANVMPRLHELQAGPARAAIRDLFMRHIVGAKGFDAVARLLDGILMPTPAAVLRAARLLADGAEGEGGIGPLLVVDVGGATTDIHSITSGRPTEPGIQMRGLSEPYAKRTVEADLGMRHSAPSLMELAGSGRILTALALEAGEAGRQPSEKMVKQSIGLLAARPDHVPEDPPGRALDLALAAVAAAVGLRRHAGRLREVPGPFGNLRIQEGKDLRDVKRVIGTGGVFRAMPAGSAKQFPTTVAQLVRGMEERYDGQETGCRPPLLPDDWNLTIDRHYLLSAMGLLAEVEPRPAIQVLKRYLDV
ncbi:MAG: methylaspartate mutase accessory protein GlmL [Thermaerobacterales bacterium]